VIQKKFEFLGETQMSQNEKEVTISEQMKKFLIKGFYGFNTILLYGLGRRLGIFDYLYERAKNLS